MVINQSNFLEPFSYLIYALALFFEYKRDKIHTKKVLFVFYLVSTILITYACIIVLDTSANNNWIYNIHYLLSAVLFGYYFFNIIKSNSLRIVVLALFSIAFIYLLITGFFLEENFFNSYGSALLFIIVVASSLIYLRQRFSQLSEENILFTFDLWLVSGYVLFFLGGFFVILTYNYYSYKLPEEKWNLLADIWGVQNILLFIGSLLALTGHLWIFYRKTLR